MKNIALILTLIAQVTTSDAFPIQEIKDQLNQLKERQIHPVAVFDLDETLIHSAKRKILSYDKAISINRPVLFQNWPEETLSADQYFSKKEDALMLSLPNQYDSTLFFKKIGIQNADFVKQLDSFMLPIYLSNDFIPVDTANRGAVQLLELVYQAKGEVHFVSSRYQSTQESGTIKNLVDLHLYRNSRQSFLHLRNDGERSLDFKVRSYSEIKAGIVANQQIFIVAENEPENFNALTQYFPNVLSIFVTGAIMNLGIKLNQVPFMITTKNFIQD